MEKGHLLTLSAVVLSTVAVISVVVNQVKPQVQYVPRVMVVTPTVTPMPTLIVSPSKGVSLSPTKASLRSVSPLQTASGGASRR